MAPREHARAGCRLRILEGAGGVFPGDETGCRARHMSKILIVDDSRTDRYAVRSILEPEGYEVLCAGNGEQGVELALTLPPDLIIMDVVMPGMGGFKAIRTLSRNPSTREIPIIVLSAKDQQSDMVWARTQGARDYIVKPPARDLLLASVARLLPEEVRDRRAN